MSYKVKQIKKRFFVVNTETNEVIEMPMQRQEANDLARKLNLGTGFAEFPIPAFILKSAQPIL